MGTHSQPIIQKHLIDVYEMIGMKYSWSLNSVVIFCEFSPAEDSEWGQNSSRSASCLKVEILLPVKYRLPFCSFRGEIENV